MWWNHFWENEYWFYIYIEHQRTKKMRNFSNYKLNIKISYLKFKEMETANPPLQLFVHPSICPSVHLFVCSNICLFVRPCVLYVFSRIHSGAKGILYFTKPSVYVIFGLLTRLKLFWAVNVPVCMHSTWQCACYFLLPFLSFCPF